MLKQKDKQQSDSEKDRLGLRACSNCIGLSSRILELEEAPAFMPGKLVEEALDCLRREIKIDTNCFSING